MNKIYNLVKLGDSSKIYVPTAMKNFKTESDYYNALEQFSEKMPEVIGSRHIPHVLKDHKLKSDFIKDLNSLEVTSQRLGIAALDWEIENLKSILLTNTMATVVETRHRALLEAIDNICAHIDKAEEKEIPPDEQKQILMINHVNETVDYVKELLKKRYKVQGADTPDGALEFLASHPIDLILLEIELPQKDGFELLKEIKSMYSYKKTPVIIFTASSQIQHVKTAQHFGVNDFVLKNVDPALLKVKIDKCFV